MIPALWYRCRPAAHRQSRLVLLCWQLYLVTIKHIMKLSADKPSQSPTALSCMSCVHYMLSTSKVLMTLDVNIKSWPLLSNVQNMFDQDHGLVHCHLCFSAQSSDCGLPTVKVCSQIDQRSTHSKTNLCLHVSESTTSFRHHICPTSLCILLVCKIWD
jgi:hypothetical protein